MLFQAVNIAQPLIVATEAIRSKRAYFMVLLLGMAKIALSADLAENSVFNAQNLFITAGKLQRNFLNNSTESVKVQPQASLLSNRSRRLALLVVAWATFSSDNPRSSATLFNVSVIQAGRL